MRRIQVINVQERGCVFPASPVVDRLPGVTDPLRRQRALARECHTSVLRVLHADERIGI